MKVYIQKIQNYGGLIGLIKVRYYYDRELRLWTVYPIDDIGNQLSDEADYYHSKDHLLDALPELKFIQE